MIKRDSYRRQWQDTFVKMYPELSNGIDHAVKTITFVVTEDCSYRCKYCISGDTEVNINEFETVKIKDISIGDSVLGFHEYAPMDYGVRELKTATVTKVFKRTADTIKITLENGMSLQITKGHPILSQWWINDNSWIMAGDYILGDNVSVLYNGNRDSSKIVDICDNGEIEVYNLETTTNTYFANGFAVHNCYEHNKDFNAYMSKETAKQAIETILDNTKMGGYIDSNKSPGVIIEFMGGEPLLNIDVMTYIAEYFTHRAFELDHPYSKYYMFNFTTNGSEYFKPKVQEFINRFGSRLSFTITLDGNKELHDSCRVYPDGSGTYDDTIKAVIHAKENYNMNTSKITLAPENLIYMNDAIKHFLDLGITSLHANPVYEPVWKIEHARLYYKELMNLADFFIDNKLYQTHTCSLFDENIGQPQGIENNQNYCGGNGAMMSIGVNGQLYPCIRFMPYSIGCKRKPLVIGNIWDGISDVETNEDVQSLWQVTRRSQCCGKSEKCFDCPVSSGCGECNGLVYELTGSPNGKLMGICDMHKARVLVNHYYWNKLYELEGENKHLDLHLPQEDIDNISNFKEIHNG